MQILDAAGCVVLGATLPLVVVLVGLAVFGVGLVCRAVRVAIQREGLAVDQVGGSGSGRPTVGIIGGSGLYQMLDGGETLEVSTPYGPPSGPITIAPVGDTTVAFLSRHGPRHELPPHGVNYRANAWALRELGVRRVLAPCAVGSLDASLGPGALVVPDQLVDWTTGRTQTFHDRF